MVNKKIVFGIVLSFLVGCKALPLQTTRIDNNSNALKIQGYYYAKVQEIRDVKYYQAIVLYKNGVMKILGVLLGNDFSSHDKRVTNGYAPQETFKEAYNWGEYVINGKNLTTEGWNSGPDRPIILDKTGIILNDSTFTQGCCEIRDTYHFRPLAIKPDSVNTWIK
jgi:hypothetical protein